LGRWIFIGFLFDRFISSQNVVALGFYDHLRESVGSCERSEGGVPRLASRAEKGTARRPRYKESQFSTNKNFIANKASKNKNNPFCKHYKKQSHIINKC
jgi:hypothetical protein